MDKEGLIRPPDVVTPREDAAQRLTNGLSQHIVRVERAWYKAMQTLQRLQDRREKRTVGSAESTGASVECIDGSSRVELVPGERVAAAAAGALTHAASAGGPAAAEITDDLFAEIFAPLPYTGSAAAALLRDLSKNDEQSEKRGDPNAKMGVTPAGNDRKAAARSRLGMARRFSRT